MLMAENTVLMTCQGVPQSTSGCPSEYLVCKQLLADYLQHQFTKPKNDTMSFNLLRLAPNYFAVCCAYAGDSAILRSVYGLKNRLVTLPVGLIHVRSVLETARWHLVLIWAVLSSVLQSEDRVNPRMQMPTLYCTPGGFASFGKLTDAFGELVDAELKPHPYAKLILFAFVVCARHYPLGRTAWIHATKEDLASNIGISKSSVARNLPILIACGALTRHPKLQSSCYHLPTKFFTRGTTEKPKFMPYALSIVDGAQYTLKHGTVYEA